MVRMKVYIVVSTSTETLKTRPIGAFLTKRCVEDFKSFWEGWYRLAQSDTYIEELTIEDKFSLYINEDLIAYFPDKELLNWSLKHSNITTEYRIEENNG